MKIALAQLNTIVGDFAGNQALVLDAYRKSVAGGANLVLTPELVITGYPPRDLVHRSRFVPGNIETLHAIAAEVGEQFASWGIPTAAAVATVRKAVGPGVKIIASGGMRTGLDIAKALALGADLGGMALPLFKAQQQGGAAAVTQALEMVVTALTQALVLAGARNAMELKRRPRVITGELKDWVAAL